MPTPATPPNGSAPLERRFAALFGPGGTSAGRPDAELLERFRRDRDAAAFEAIVLRHGPVVLAICRRALRDDAADAFQATFLALLEHGGSIRDGDCLAPWLHRTARRVCLRQLERRPLGVEAAADGTAEPIDGSTPPPTAVAERLESAAVLHDEIARLPRPFREAVELCGLDGLTHEQAAGVLGCPIGTVRSRVARARARLRARLEQRGLPAVLPAGPAPVELPSRYVDAALRLAADSPEVSARVAALAAAAGVGRHGALPLLGLRVAAVGLAASAVLGAAVGGQDPPPGVAPAAAPAPAAPRMTFAEDAGRRDRLNRLGGLLDQAARALAAGAQVGPPGMRRPASEEAFTGLLQLGALQAATGEVEAACGTFRAAFRLGQGLSPALVRGPRLATMARNQAGVGDRGGALESLDRARRDLEGELARARQPAAGDADPERPNLSSISYALRALGGAQARVGDTDGLDATMALLRGWAAGPDRVSGSSRFDLLWLLARIGRLDEALALVAEPPYPDLAKLREAERLRAERGETPPPPTLNAPGWNALIAYRERELIQILSTFLPGWNRYGCWDLGRIDAWLREHPRCASFFGNREVGLTAARMGCLDLARSHHAGAWHVANDQLGTGDRDGAAATIRRNLEARKAPLVAADWLLVRMLLDAGDPESAAREARRLPVGAAPEAVRILMAVSRAYDRSGRPDAAAEARRWAQEVAEARRARPEAEAVPMSPIAGGPPAAMLEDRPGREDAEETRLAYGRGRLAELADALGEADEAGRLIALRAEGEDRESLRRALAIERAVTAAAETGDLAPIAGLASPASRVEAIGQVVVEEARRAGVELIVRYAAYL